MTGVQTCALPIRSEEHTSELQPHDNLVCRLLLEKKEDHDRRRFEQAGAPEPLADRVGGQSKADHAHASARGLSKSSLFFLNIGRPRISTLFPHGTPFL